MPRVFAAALLCGLLVAGCSTAPVADAPVTPDLSGEPAPQPRTGGALPANTELILRLNSTLGSSNSRIGDTFTAAIENDVTALNGDVILPAGTLVTGMVTGVDASTGTGDTAAIRLNLLRINISGVTHPFRAAILGTVEAQGARNADAPAGPATRGTVIGSDVSEAVLGTPMPPGAGTIISLGAAVDAVLPEGTNLVVRTRERIELDPR